MPICSLIFVDRKKVSKNTGKSPFSDYLRPKIASVGWNRNLTSKQGPLLKFKKMLKLSQTKSVKL